MTEHDSSVRCFRRGAFCVERLIASREAVGAVCEYAAKSRSFLADWNRACQWPYWLLTSWK